MSDISSIAFDAVQAGIKSGVAEEPAALLAVIAGLDNPLVNVFDHDSSRKLSTTFDQDFGFIRVARAAGNPFSPMERDKLVSLFRWLISESRQWRRDADRADVKLATLMFVMHACDCDNELWAIMPSNSDLSDRLKRLLSAITFRFETRGDGPGLLWEREAVNRLKTVEDQADWAAISHAWRPFESMVQQHWLHIQVVRCLYHSGVTCLADALANLHQIAVGMLVASILATNERLRLAVASDNPYVQFCCLQQTLADHRTQPDSPSAEQEQFLTSLLLKVSEDRPRWAAWMQAFNVHPIMHTALQRTLGMVLAKGPDAAIEPYVYSIVLNPIDNPLDAGRQAVATCLRTFHANASSERRKALWTLAHRRWTDWAFNREDSNCHLFKINFSKMDFALVGYAYECLDKAGRKNAMDLIRSNAEVLEETWYESLSAIRTEWYRLHSFFQPYAHAEAAYATGADWLCENLTYWPYDPAMNEYGMSKFQLAYRAVQA